MTEHNSRKFIDVNEAVALSQGYIGDGDGWSDINVRRLCQLAAKDGRFRVAKWFTRTTLTDQLGGKHPWAIDRRSFLRYCKSPRRPGRTNS